MAVSHRECNTIEANKLDDGRDSSPVNARCNPPHGVRGTPAAKQRGRHETALYEGSVRSLRQHKKGGIGWANTADALRNLRHSGTEMLNRVASQPLLTA